MPDENELYEEWRSAPEAKRSDVEEKLLQKVLSHARAVVWETLHEWNPDIVQDVAIAVWRGLARFRRESKFSTWVHSIAKYKAYEEIRNRVRRRTVFDERKVVVANPGDDKENDRAVYPTTLPNLEGPIILAELCQGLPEDAASLLRCKREEMGTEEIAAKMGIGPEAIASRWARLRRKLKEKLRPYDGKHGDGTTNSR